MTTQPDGGPEIKFDLVPSFYTNGLFEQDCEYQKKRIERLFGPTVTEKQRIKEGER